MANYKHPRITVLMPVYNCELFIKEAVDSILNQTFDNFEFLIIDDASTDKTVDIINTYTDTRIQLIEKPVNSGITNSLNFGLKIAKGEYIARMDGDDISLSKRFAKQVAFLDANPDVVLCGTNFSIIGREKVINLPKTNEDIKIALLKGNCIAHPSVMMRNSALEKFNVCYDSKTEPAEDYDLWVRLINKGKLVNLEEILLQYRVHTTQVSQKRECQQINSALESRIKMLKYLDYPFNKTEDDLLKKLMQRNSSLTFQNIQEFINLYKKMLLSNSNNFFDTKELKKYLSELQNQNLKEYFVHRVNFYPLNFCQYFLTKKRVGFKLKLKEELKLMVKCLIFFKSK
jgi:glycosyltransferase involved in cell wall biosynthesis